MQGTSDLTPSQRQAVEHLDGPLLVLAGPGSGKTRVITRRIARMIERDVDPRQILAITFTNKAASEMAARVAQLLPGTRVWVGTFHKFCARLLRQRARLVGLQPNFTIYDTADQQQVLRRVLSDLDIDAVHFPPSRLLHRISRAKNDQQTAEDFARKFEESIGSAWEAVVAKVYPAYQKALLASNAVDFDDLLLHVVTVLTENPELRAELDARYRYVLVDEYQDTNFVQYRLIAALSQDHPNLCVTGDPDQSIYGWRGAQIENILRFESDYPQAKVVRLEQNFRSTPQILQAADELIVHNQRRKAKALVTDNTDGEPVELLGFRDGRQEADHIAAAIRRTVECEGRKWSDFAVFYRVNALSREMERALGRHRVPYQVAAGVAFYERSEIKDLLAYLRLLHNPDDLVAFRRVINSPPRGIGATTQSRLLDWAGQHALKPLEAAARADEHPKLPKKATASLQSFSRMIAELSLADAGSVEALLSMVIDRTGYIRGLADSPSEEDQQRVANVLELLTAARQFDAANPEERSLEGFLETTSLASDIDAIDPEAGQVTLMTLHAAKGLEFPVVYIVAVEQGLIPHDRSIREGDVREFEEERRLLFVGITRARERLFLTRTAQRETRGRLLTTIQSDFLAEMNLTVRDLAGEEWDEECGMRSAECGVRNAEAEEPAQSESSIPHSAFRTPHSGRPKLTTGADLLNGAATPAELPQGFHVGMAVRHPRYGLGTVVGVSGMSKNRTLTVHFEEDGTKSFVAAKCPLQPVGTR